MDKILEDREKRYNEILDLIGKYSLPVVCGKLNYPGMDKNTPEAGRGFNILKEVLGEAFGRYSIKEIITDGADGSALLIAAALKPESAKAIAVEIEESHRLGRIFDIDVYTINGSPISRTELGGKWRSCIVCGEDARQCIKAEKHGLQEVVDCVNKLLKKCGE